MNILTSELLHGLSGHWRTVSAEVELSQVGQYGRPVSHAAEQTQTQLHSFSTNRRVKPGFHYQRWRPELTGDRFPLPVNAGRVDGRAFPLAELTGRQCWLVLTISITCKIRITSVVNYRYQTYIGLIA